MKPLCGWKDDPRDNGVTWSVVHNPSLYTNMLCLAPLASNRASVEVFPPDDDDDEVNEPVLRAKLWSPKFRVVKAEAPPQCVQFAFMFDQETTTESSSPFYLIVMRHSAR